MTQRNNDEKSEDARERHDVAIAIEHESKCKHEHVGGEYGLQIRNIKYWTKSQEIRSLVTHGSSTGKASSSTYKNDVDDGRLAKIFGRGGLRVVGLLGPNAEVEAVGNETEHGHAIQESRDGNDLGEIGRRRKVDIVGQFAQQIVVGRCLRSTKSNCKKCHLSALI